MVLSILLFLSTGLFAQLDLDKLKELKPRAIGPAGMSGRVTAVDVVNDHPEIIYVGTASGGLWMSESGGVEWEPVFEKEAVASIGSVAIQQSNPDVIWVGTGEGNPRNSVSGGYGIYKSLDGGKHWKLMGLEKTRNIHRIVIDKDNPNTVYVGAIGSPWGEHPERGVFKTTDGGKTWSKVLYVDEKTGCADLVVDPSNPNKLIAAMWEHRRKPWTFNSGGPGSGLYITFDGGETWEKKTDKDGLPKGNLGRIGLAFAPSEPRIIYALVEAKKNALYRSDDGGFKWQMINDKPDIGNRPFYYSDIFVDPLNENRVYSVFTYINVSEDGGRSFSQLMPAYGTTKGVHPDHHAWWIHPTDPDYMIDGNDGGMNITHDRGKTWRFVENLPVAQFYHINVDMEYPYNVYGGMQDNGSWGGPAYVLKDQGIRNSYWQELMFGDGFDVVPDPKDSRYGYAMSQEGFIGRYDLKTGNTKMIRPTHPDPDVQLRFNWNSALAMDPFDQTTLYFGSQFVHKSSDHGYTWEIISPDLTTNDPEKLKQYESGGLTMDATGAENHCTVLAIAPSPIEKGLIWVGTDDGNVQLTRDGGSTWTNVSPYSAGMPKGSWVPQIKPSEFSAGEAYVIVNNYRNFDFKPYLFRTKDYGATWESLVEEKNIPGYTLSLVQDPKEKKLVFLGTEYGLYISIDEAKTWTKWTNGFPTVSTMDLAIHPREQDLVIATFGRAAFILDDIRPLRAIASEGKEILDRQLVLFDPPSAFINEYQQPSGTRFGANAIFNGENRPGGAMISFLVNKPKMEKKAESKEDDETSERIEGKEEGKEKIKLDSIKLEIFNVGGECIRILKQKTPEENGFHRMYWYLDEKGVRGPSRRERRGGRGEPGGVTVLPGKYMLKMTFGDQVDSVYIDVDYDPRIEMPMEVLVQQHDLLKELESKTEVAGKAVERLRASLEIIDDYKSRIEAEKDKTAFEDLLKRQKTLKDTINTMMDELLGKEDKRQGITMDEKPSTVSYLYTARSYVRSLQAVPGPTERQLIKNADDKLNQVLDKINNFYLNEWPVYRKEVEELKLSPFKDLEPLKLKE
ncbi:MAG: hypothetical protein KDC85_11015 [Saprospiraceae bacterium]|nr:hypothetical protein [Saprospiraceae bacterium]